MTDMQAVWATAQDTMMAFSPYYQVAMVDAIQAADSGGDWVVVKQAMAATPFTITDFHQLAPYANQAAQVERLADLAEKGYLAPISNGVTGAYEVTEKGRAMIAGIFKGAHESLTDLLPLGEAKMDRIADLLRRVVAATEAAPEPVHKLALKSSRVTMPGDNVGPAAHIDQYLTDLLTYRDDAHVNAWQSLGVTGPTWEAFTLIWREQANTAAALAERLNNRNNDVAVYETALEDLVERDWIAAADEGYAATTAGKQVREAIEAETDRLFFIGWDALSAAEVAELHERLTELGTALRTESQKALWQLTLEVSQGIGQASQSATQEVFAANYAKPGFFFPTLIARGAAPEPFSADVFARRGPYNNPARTEQGLAEAAEAGFYEVRDDGYYLTDKAQAAIEAVNDVFYGFLTDLETINENQLATLENLLGRLAEAARTGAEPDIKWNIENTHNGHSDVSDRGPLARIDQHIDELGAFRDDSHLASWADYDIDGRTWEAFSFIWNERAHNAAELAEKLPFRGYASEDYAAALADLVEMGWLEPAGDGFAVTEAGAALRQTAEEQTDAYFFRPWQELSGQQLGQLQVTLTRLKTRLAELAPVPEAA